MASSSSLSGSTLDSTNEDASNSTFATEVSETETSDIVFDPLERPNRPKSIVWDFFAKKNVKSVTCRLCQKQYAYHGGTTNLRDHLTRCHPKEFLSSTSTKKQPSLDTFLSRSKCSAAR